MSKDVMGVQEVSPGYEFVAGNPAVPVGYKQTEVGVIPKDWEIVPLGNCVLINSGDSPAKINFSNEGMPYFKVEQLGNHSKYLSVRSTPYHFLRGKSIPAGSIIFAKRGAAISLNRIRIITHESYMDTNLMTLTPLENYFSEYLFYQLSYMGLWQFADTTSIPQINNKHIKPLKVLIPTIREQRAIATALSDMDALLEELDRLIAKKRDIKQGAMQQLLTGETRLPGFEGDWEAIPLGSLGRFLKGSGVKRDDAMSGNIPCIRYGEIYTLHNDVIREFHSWISDEVAQSAVPIQKGDVLFAGSGETKEEIGKCVALVDEVAAYAGGDIVILRTSNADPTFLGYALNQPSVIRQKSRFGQGDAVVHISAASLAKVIVKVPCLEEQKAIAAVLSDMDAEIQALEQHRSKTAELKQGMMQELLTGRTRLV